MSAIPQSQASLPLLGEYPEETSYEAPICSLCQKIIQENGVNYTAEKEGLSDREINQQSTSPETIETIDKEVPVQRNRISPETIEKLRECGRGLGLLAVCIGCFPCFCVMGTINCIVGDDD